MDRKTLLSRISIDPQVRFGRPCIKGNRIWVSLVLDWLAGGMTVKEILDDYPGLEKDDILACLAFGAEMSRERVIDFSEVGAKL